MGSMSMMFFFFFFDSAKELFKPGTVCRIKGQKDNEPSVVVHQVYTLPDGISLWCYQNRPVTYKLNRKKQKVIDFDPACIMSPYSPEDLIITNEPVLQDGGWGASYRR